MLRIILITLLFLLAAAVVYSAIVEPKSLIIWAFTVTPILRFNHNTKALR